MVVGLDVGNLSHQLKRAKLVSLLGCYFVHQQTYFWPRKNIWLGSAVNVPSLESITIVKISSEE